MMKHAAVNDPDLLYFLYKVFLFGATFPAQTFYQDTQEHPLPQSEEHCQLTIQN